MRLRFCDWLLILGLCALAQAFSSPRHTALPAPVQLYGAGETCPSDASASFRSAFEHGMTAMHRHAWAEAVLDYSEVPADDPYLATALEWRSLAFHFLNQDQLALADLDRAIVLQPGFAWALNDRAYLRAADMQQADSQALADSERAIALDPSPATYYDTRGYICLSQGQPGRALPDLQKAAQGEARRSHFEHLASAYEALGARDQAREARDQAAEAQEPWE